MMQRPEVPNPKTEESARHVAVYGGGTAAADLLLGQAVAELAKSNRWVVHVAPNLFWALPSDMDKGLVAPIQPGFNSYDECGVVVMRPGVGSMTAAVESGTPIVALAESNNAEMQDNAARIAALGIGLDAGSDPAKVVEAVTALTQPGEVRQAVQENLRSQPREGIAQAAAFLVTHITNLHNSPR